MIQYSEKLSDPRWQKRRLEIMSRDGFKCVICQDESKELHVHHYSYRGQNPWDAGDGDMATLCSDCHTMMHMDKKKFAAFVAFTGEYGSYIKRDSLGISATEKWLLKMIFLDASHVEWLRRYLNIDWIRNLDARELVFRVLSMSSNGYRITGEYMLAHTYNEEMLALVREATCDTRPIPNPLQQLADLVVRLRNEWIDNQLRCLSRVVTREFMSNEDRFPLLERIQELRIAKRAKLSEIVSDVGDNRSSLTPESS